MLATIIKHTFAMNTEREKKIRDEASKVLTEVTQFKPSELLRLELGTELSFEKGIVIIESFINFFKNLANCNFEEMPIRYIDIINKEAVNAKNILTEIRDFSLQKFANNPIGTRDQFLNTLQDHYSTSIEKLSFIVEYFKPKEKLENIEIEAKNSIEEIRNLKIELAEEKEKTNRELNEILDTARQTVSKIGVASHAVHFKEEAEENLNASKNWLIALVFCILITIGWGIACFFIHPESEKSRDILQFTIAKIIILSGLYYGLSTISKNYKAHRHNYIVNKHKQNSLNSFEAFVKGSGDDIQTKNAVLISATQSIFSAQPSGYSNQDTENEPSKIIEILKTTQSAK
jgi:hypothetical protein